MRSIKKVGAFILCAVFMLCLLSGCGGETANEGQNSKNSISDGQLAELNIEGAYKSFAPDTVVMTLNGRDVTWQEFFYFVNFAVKNVESQAGDIENWLADAGDGHTYFDYAVSMAIDQNMSNAAVIALAKEVNIYGKDEAKEYAKKLLQDAKDSYESAEEFNKALAEAYETEELFLQFAENSYYYDQAYIQLFGEKGEKLSDEDVAEQVEGENYLMAKHILVLTQYSTDDGETISFNDEEKAEALAKIQDFHDQLDACETQEEMEALFDELMNEYSEDEGGVKSFPDGYLFKEGDMVKEFYEGCKALEIGQYSDVIESSYGYHIILRLPINYDEVPTAYAAYKAYGYDYYSLRYITSRNMLSAIMNALASKVEYSMADDFANMNFAELFA